MPLFICIIPFTLSHGQEGIHTARHRVTTRKNNLDQIIEKVLSETCVFYLDIHPRPACAPPMNADVAVSKYFIQTWGERTSNAMSLGRLSSHAATTRSGAGAEIVAICRHVWLEV